MDIRANKSSFRRVQRKLLVGLSLIASAPVLYFVYHFTGNNLSPFWWLPPFGVIVFLGGFYICKKTGIELFQKLDLPVKLLAAGITITWLFYFETDLANSVVDTFFASGLSWISAIVSTNILNLIGVGAHLTGQTVVFPAGSKISGIEILNACSGVQASTAFLVAFGLVLLDLGGKISKKKLLILIALGPAMIYGVNILRILALSLIGYFLGYSPLSIAHEYLDFIVFIAEVSVFWWLSLRWAHERKSGNSKFPGTSPGLDLKQGAL